MSGEHISPNLVKITSNSSMEDGDYFPEGYFAQWLHENRITKTPVYCFEKVGVVPLKEEYNRIDRLHKIDTALLIDDGIDGIFRGDEYGLGTPSMDSVSMIAANESNIKSKYYIFTAFASEGVGKEVSHADALLRVSNLIQCDGYYGVSTLVKNDKSILQFISACNYIFGKMPKHQHSNIICSMLKSLEGCFGYMSVNERTKIEPLWISALTSIYWFFDLDKTAKMKLFYQDVLNTATVAEVSDAIDKLRRNIKSGFMNIPI